jgi:hypothetical protein
MFSKHLSMPQYPTKAEREREITALATEFITLMERMREFKIAGDHFGDKHYHQTRRMAVAALVRLLRATALAARGHQNA